MEGVMPLQSEHGTLVASTVTTCTLVASGRVTLKYVKIVNRSGSAEITAVVGEVGVADPTVAAADSIVLPAVAGYTVIYPLSARYDSGLAVKLISAGTPTFSVEAYDEVPFGNGD